MSFFVAQNQKITSLKFYASFDQILKKSKNLAPNSPKMSQNPSKIDFEAPKN